MINLRRDRSPGPLLRPRFARHLTSTAAALLLMSACGGPDLGRSSLSTATPSLVTATNRARNPVKKGTTLDPRPKTTHRLASTRYPITVHWIDSVTAERAQRVLSLVETAWHLEVETMGWARPLPDGGRDGDDNFDVYIYKIGPGQAFVSEEARPPGPFAVATSYMGLDNNLPDDGTLESYVFHEFNHACQYALDANESNTFFEHSAVLMDRKLHPTGPESRTGLDDFQAAPEHALDWIAADGVKNYYEYGAAMFQQYLSERYAGGSTDLCRRLWESGRQPDRPKGANDPNWIDVLPTVLSEFHAPGPDQVLADFEAWRLQEALQHPDRFPVPSLVYDGPRIDSFHPETGKAPAPWGANFLKVQSGAAKSVTVRLQASGQARWRLWAGAQTADGRWLQTAMGQPGTAQAGVQLTTEGASAVYLSVIDYGAGQHNPDRKQWQGVPYQLHCDWTD